MNPMFTAGAVISVAWLSIFVSSAHAAPCLMITLTGTQGGPPAFKGLAGLERWCAMARTAVYRQEVRPFTDTLVALLKNFAAQAITSSRARR
jgi:hypothetical protein